MQPETTSTDDLMHQVSLLPMKTPLPLANSINVYVRVKPLNVAESEGERNRQWQIINEEKGILHTYTREMFTFDRVFNEHMSTAQIFESQCKKLILSSLEGFNVTIFTYGQTASGKTYTMRGLDTQQPGLIPLSIKEVFRELYLSHGTPFKPHTHMHHHHHLRESLSPKTTVLKTWLVKVSYIEIYNECVNDLLDPTRKNLSVRENQQGRPIVEGLSEFEIHSPEEAMQYLLKGDEQRKIAETRLNEKSSRSHTVFKLSILLSEKNLQTSRNTIKTSQVNLVDLAGSEGVSKTQSEGVRFREGSNINKSLLALSKVIQMLGLKFASQSKSTQSLQQTQFINFRDSKLTRILQQALSGNSMTSIICTMSQLFNNYQESKETLNFGSKAKQVKTIVNVNEIIRDSPEEVAQRIQKLSRENEDLKSKLAAAKDEMMRMFERQEELTALGNLREHQEYLMKLIDEKNDQVVATEAKCFKITQQFDEQKKKIQDMQSQVDRAHAEITQAKVQAGEELAVRERYWQDKVEELILSIQEFERLLQPEQNHGNQVLRKSLHTLKAAMNNISLNADDVYLVEQRSKLEISGTSLLSRQTPEKPNQTLQHDQQHTNKNESESDVYARTIQVLEAHISELELQIMGERTQCTDLRDAMNMEKGNNLRLMQQVRALRVEAKKKDKLISKKNFQIGNLLEKIQVLERSNASLFRELDQTIGGCSFIQQPSQLDIIAEEAHDSRTNNHVLHSPDDTPRSLLHHADLHQNPDPSASLRRKSTTNVKRLSSPMDSALLRAQLLEMSKRVEILESDKAALVREKEQLQVDLDEAEQNLAKLAIDIKEQDYDFLEVLDENEEIEGHYEELAREYEKGEQIIQEQRQAIERAQFEKEDLQGELEKKDQALKDKEREVELLKEAIAMRQKKRKLDEINSSETSGGVKKMRLNPVVGSESGSAQSTGRQYHRLCKQVACGNVPHPEHTLPPLAVVKKPQSGKNNRSESRQNTVSMNMVQPVGGFEGLQNNKENVNKQQQQQITLPLQNKAKFQFTMPLPKPQAAVGPSTSTERLQKQKLQWHF
ncbi:hypothetical protein FGO68_gene10895 [Halteria grandinella]|uniref:Kinesin motor domain-containing protein n=1 Tax=Halteria grandinella TaxID=5974 RepID=A0A8J8P097_HALGN|nr:hypothetical protein FGO68_gene10895 [Halteria grandinella]